MEGKYREEKTNQKENNGLDVDCTKDFSASPKACLMCRTFPTAQAVRDFPMTGIYLCY